MNRFEMAAKIDEHAHTLAVRDKDEWKRAEKWRQKFVTDYPIDRIRTLELDDYVIGKGGSNRSFCYRLEREEMETLGRLQAQRPSSLAFTMARLRATRRSNTDFAHWGTTATEALKSVKLAIVALLNAAEQEDIAGIANNDISPMFKGKLLFLYHPEKYAPIYSEEHLRHFITSLNLGGAFVGGADMQRELMRYRTTWPQLMAHPPTLYMRFLCDVFGYPPHPGAPLESRTDEPLLHEALHRALFISEMPASLVMQTSKSDCNGKADYIKRQTQQRRIGDRGEKIVFHLERARLQQAGKPDLATQVEHISEKDDLAGYDILSFDVDGRKRHIEVKATTAANLDLGFYISSNELEKSTALDNYYLYLVFSAMSKRPRVLPLAHPRLDAETFVLRPVSYHVTLPNH